MIRELKSIGASKCLANFTECSVNLGGCSVVNWLLSGWEIFSKNILADTLWHWQRVRQLKSVASNLSEYVNDFTKHSVVIDGMSVKSLSEKLKCLTVLLFQWNITSG
jgi:hypothetical protein